MQQGWCCVGAPLKAVPYLDAQGRVQLIELVEHVANRCRHHSRRVNVPYIVNHCPTGMMPHCLHTCIHASVVLVIIVACHVQRCRQPKLVHATCESM